MRPGILFSDAFTLFELLHESFLLVLSTMAASIPFLL